MQLTHKTFPERSRAETRENGRLISGTSLLIDGRIGGKLNRLFASIRGMWRQFRTVSRLTSLIIIENIGERGREVESSFADQRNDACMQACGMKPMPCIYIYVARNWVLIRRMTELAAFILMGRLRRCFTFIYRESRSPPFNFTAIEFKFLQLTCRVSSLFGEQYAGNSHLYEILKLFDSISQLHAN